jgi:hypothetical protein
VGCSQISLQLKRRSDEGYATSHRFNWSPLPPNEVGRIAQHVREAQGRKEGRKKERKKDEVQFILILLLYRTLNISKSKVNEGIKQLLKYRTYYNTEVN